MRNRKGFTLVEAAISIALIAIAIVPLVNIMYPVSVNRTKLKIIDNVAYLAEMKMEETINIFKENYNASPQTSGDFSSESDISDAGKYKFTLDYSNEEISGYLRDITLTVYYDENGNGSFDSGEKEITLHTKVAKHDDND